ncbi:DUF721 domain-containing protein [Patescibacteria group bacterium]
MSFVRIKEVLKKALHQKGLVQAAESGFVCNQWKKVINELLGEKIQKQSKVISFKGGELKIAVLNSVVQQELQLHSREIIQNINQKLEDQKVERIRLVN